MGHFYSGSRPSHIYLILWKVCHYCGGLVRETENAKCIFDLYLPWNFRWKTWKHFYTNFFQVKTKGHTKNNNKTISREKETIFVKPGRDSQNILRNRIRIFLLENMTQVFLGEIQGIKKEKRKDFLQDFSYSKQNYCCGVRCLFIFPMYILMWGEGLKTNCCFVQVNSPSGVGRPPGDCSVNLSQEPESHVSRQIRFRFRKTCF